MKLISKVNNDFPALTKWKIYESNTFVRNKDGSYVSFNESNRIKITDDKNRVLYPEKHLFEPYYEPLIKGDTVILPDKRMVYVLKEENNKVIVKDWVNKACYDRSEVEKYINKNKEENKKDNINSNNNTNNLFFNKKTMSKELKAQEKLRNLKTNFLKERVKKNSIYYNKIKNENYLAIIENIQKIINLDDLETPSKKELINVITLIEIDNKNYIESDNENLETTKIVIFDWLELSKKYWINLTIKIRNILLENIGYELIDKDNKNEERIILEYIYQNHWLAKPHDFTSKFKIDDIVEYEDSFNVYTWKIKAIIFNKHYFNFSYLTTFNNNTIPENELN